MSDSTGMKPIVIDLMDLVEQHGASSARVETYTHTLPTNKWCDDGSTYKVKQRTIILTGCKSAVDGDWRPGRYLPVAQGAVIDESRYIAHKVAERLDR